MAASAPLFLGDDDQDIMDSVQRDDDAEPSPNASPTKSGGGTESGESGDDGDEPPPLDSYDPDRNTDTDLLLSFDPTSGDFRSALGLDDDDDDDSPGGGSFDDGSFGGSEGAAPTPAGIDGAIAEEDEGEDASPAK